MKTWFLVLAILAFGFGSLFVACGDDDDTSDSADDDDSDDDDADDDDVSDDDTVPDWALTEDEAEQCDVQMGHYVEFCDHGYSCATISSDWKLCENCDSEWLCELNRCFTDCMEDRYHYSDTAPAPDDCEMGRNCMVDCQSDWYDCCLWNDDYDEASCL